MTRVHWTLLLVVLTIFTLDGALYMVLRAWDTEPGIQLTRAILGKSIPAAARQSGNVIFLPIVMQSPPASPTPRPASAR